VKGRTTAATEGNRVTERPKSDPRIALAIDPTGFAKFRTSLARILGGQEWSCLDA
jgi:hypothetical protein